MAIISWGLRCGFHTGEKDGEAPKVVAEADGETQEEKKGEQESPQKRKRRPRKVLDDKKPSEEQRTSGKAKRRRRGNGECELIAEVRESLSDGKEGTVDDNYSHLRVNAPLI